MPFIANYDSIGAGYHINEVDADGVTKFCGTPQSAPLRIYSSGLQKDINLVESVSRLILIALNMEGGLDRATELLRAEAIRSREAS